MTIEAQRRLNPCSENVLRSTLWPILKGQVPRALGLGDRQSDSPTYGCFDRAYWHYRTIDFPNCRYQEAAYFLSALYCWSDPDNQYANVDMVKKWARAAIRAWERQRNADGACNEAFPRDRSYCGTAFSLASVLEADRRVGGLREDACNKTVEWLISHNKQDVANQEAAAALAVWLAGDKQSQPQWQDRARQKARAVVSRQDTSGGYLEYGGIDTGYHTLTMGILSRLLKYTGWDFLSESLIQASDYIDNAIDSNGCFDITETSRRTAFIYLEGLVANQCSCLAAVIKALQENRIQSPAWMDDRYLIPFSNDYWAVLLFLSGSTQEDEFNAK